MRTSVVCHVVLNRPSYQPSVYTDTLGNPPQTIYYPSSLANDGSRIDTLVTLESSTYTPRCAATLSETNPWWAVDLGVSLSVQEIFFTNRKQTREQILEYQLTGTLKMQDVKLQDMIN